MSDALSPYEKSAIKIIPIANCKTLTELLGILIRHKFILPYQSGHAMEHYLLGWLSALKSESEKSIYLKFQAFVENKYQIFTGQSWGAIIDFFALGNEPPFPSFLGYGKHS